MPSPTLAPDARIAMAAFEAWCAKLPTQPELEQSLTAFLKDWVRYVDAAPASESEESMKTVCNAIWQIREVFVKS